MKSPASTRLRVLLVLISIIFIFLAFFFLFGNYGYIRLLHLRKEVSMLQNEIVSLKIENKTLNEKIRKINSDLFTIEKEARDRGGLAKKGEKILKFK